MDKGIRKRIGVLAAGAALVTFAAAGAAQAAPQTVTLTVGPIVLPGVPVSACVNTTCQTTPSLTSVTLSVARFLDPNSVPSSLLKLAGQVDVFVFWTVALLGLGLAVTGRVSAEKAAIVCAIIWFVGAFVG